MSPFLPHTPEDKGGIGQWSNKPYNIYFSCQIIVVKALFEYTSNRKTLFFVNSFFSYL